MEIVTYHMRRCPQLRDLTITYHVPDPVCGGTSEPGCGWPAVRDFYMQPEGPAACGRLILCLSGYDMYPTHQMSLWVEICEEINDITAHGSSLRTLEIWFSCLGGRRQRYMLNNLDVDIHHAVTSWNSNEPSLVQFSKPYWVLPLLKILGLNRIRVRFFDPSSTNIFKQVQTAHSRPIPPLQALLDRYVVLDVGTNTRSKIPFDFRFVFRQHGERHRWPMITY